jgi:hypothetical protein
MNRLARNDLIPLTLRHITQGRVWNPTGSFRGLTLQAMVEGLRRFSHQKQPWDSSR